MRHNLRHSQRGSMLIVAVFALTAMAALGTVLMQINWSQKDTTTREVLGARAWFAASSGTEYAMTKLFPLATIPANVVSEATLAQQACSAIPDVGETIDFSASGLTGCTVTVSCDIVAGTVEQYLITSKGQCGSAQFSVTRTQESWAKVLVP
ncbi:MSHA biogenesis protein MshP [Enterovibrio coralii]|uniref:MSHA biogenesis protein MshP n=1 Tax=Enterovibrio coralii TaxID=294935 RepID=A0A135I3L5_9GAMM|nr:MSHA biogenesis protein MshP [Enterovibrio coralii]KXF80032.1 MSHA biogenesis protein MshP [Enterovibrio coralii]